MVKRVTVIQHTCGRHYTYKVESTRNTTSPKLRTTLSEEQVNKLVDDGYEVTVKTSK